MLPKTTDIAALARGAKPEVVSAIRQASASTGVDFSYLLQKAATESSFDADAQAATSSARGLYQFVDSTWLDTLDRHGAEHGFEGVAELITRDAKGRAVVANPETRRQILALRDNPRISSLMAAELAKDNQASLEATLGRKVGSTELYLAHFLGAGGAAKFLECRDADPDCKAAQVMPAAAAANRGVFYAQGRSLTVEEIYARFAGQFGPEAAAAAAPEAPASDGAHAASPAAPAAMLAALEAELAAPVVPGIQPASPILQASAPLPPDEAAPMPAATAPAARLAHGPYAGPPPPTTVRIEDLPAFALMLEALALPGESDPGRKSWEWLA